MKLRFVLNKKNHNLMKVLIDVNLEKFRIKSNVWRDPDRFRDYYDDGKEESPIFVKRLEEIDGIENADCDKYCIDILKGGIFSWTDLVPVIIRVLEAEVHDGKMSSYGGAYCPKGEPNPLEVMLYSGDEKSQKISQPSSPKISSADKGEEKSDKAKKVS
ncbi:MAG: hypothetical protein WAV11_03000 [Minisyncoccia bacterium]